MPTGLTQQEIDDAVAAFGALRPAPPLAGADTQAARIASFGVSLSDREILLRYVGDDGKTGDVAISPVIAARLIQMLTRTTRTLEWLDDTGAPIARAP